MHKDDKGKKASSDPAYQDLVTAPLGRAHDEDVTGLQDEDENDKDNVPIDQLTSAEQLKEVLTAMEKVNPPLSVQNMTNCYASAS